MKQQTVEKLQKILEMQRKYPGTINDFCSYIHMSVKKEVKKTYTLFLTNPEALSLYLFASDTQQYNIFTPARKTFRGSYESGV